MVYDMSGSISGSPYAWQLPLPETLFAGALQVPDLLERPAASVYQSASGGVPESLLWLSDMVTHCL